MSRLFACLLSCFLAAGATALTSPPDTTYVLGGPDRWDGRFEDAAGQPQWHGWNHADMYALPTAPRWQVSDLLPIAGERSLWCGTTFDNPCQDGYGNDWRQGLPFSTSGRRSGNGDGGRGCTVWSVSIPSPITTSSTSRPIVVAPGWTSPGLTMATA